MKIYSFILFLVKSGTLFWRVVGASIKLISPIPEKVKTDNVPITVRNNNSNKNNKKNKRKISTSTLLGIEKLENESDGYTNCNWCSW